MDYNHCKVTLVCSHCSELHIIFMVLSLKSEPLESGLPRRRSSSPGCCWPAAGSRGASPPPTVTPRRARIPATWRRPARCVRRAARSSGGHGTIGTGKLFTGYREVWSVRGKEGWTSPFLPPPPSLLLLLLLPSSPPTFNLLAPMAHSMTNT